MKRSKTFSENEANLRMVNSLSITKNANMIIGFAVATSLYNRTGCTSKYVYKIRFIMHINYIINSNSVPVLLCNSY